MWQVWDALTGDELFELKHRKIVRAADWSADSAHIVTGGKEGVLRLYDVNRPEAEPTMLEGHPPNSLIKVPSPNPPPLPTHHIPQPQVSIFRKRKKHMTGNSKQM